MAVERDEAGAQLAASLESRSQLEAEKAAQADAAQQAEAQLREELAEAQLGMAKAIEEGNAASAAASRVDAQLKLTKNALEEAKVNGNSA